MKVFDVMSSHCEFIESNASIQQAAQKMRALDCGFLPVGDPLTGVIEGVITDRDIVVRAIANGCDPKEMRLSEIETPEVLYCYANDSTEAAARWMSEKKVYRLVVLDNIDTKRLCGIISLGDILRHNEEQLASETAKHIMSNVA